MLISDLNYFEAAEANVVGGYYGTYFNFNFNKDIDVKKNIDVYIDKDVFSLTYVKGNLAEAEAGAQSYGPDSLAETLTFSYTDPYSSVAVSESTSATN
jgi:hypothetical protein